MLDIEFASGGRSLLPFWADKTSARMEMDRRRLNGGDETTLASERNHLTVEELPNRRGNGFVVSVPPSPPSAGPPHLRPRR